MKVFDLNGKFNSCWSRELSLLSAVEAGLTRVVVSPDEFWSQKLERVEKKQGIVLWDDVGQAI